MTGFETSYGVNLPWLIYGTAWKGEKTRDLVRTAIKLGFRGIDTAGQPKHYNEGLVGEALADFDHHGVTREEIYLQTKFTPIQGQDPDNIPYDKNAPIKEQVFQSFERSKSNLRTDYVDTLILHSPLSPESTMFEAWLSMEDIFNSGGARQLGISNCYDLGTLENLYSKAVVKPSVLQNRFYNETGYDVQLREFCQKKGIIYQSFWTLTANTHILNSTPFIEIAEKYNRTCPQIFFRYLNQTNVVPLTGTSSSTHMEQDLSVLDFELSKDDVETITLRFLTR